jgi:branched-chain amino acid transport system ATP-binding protein
MTALLELTEVTTGYGDLPVTREVSLDIAAGEIVTLVGANGAGKTTLLNTITGLLRCWHGSIVFDGEELTRRPAHRIPEAGLVLVPEGRRLFPFMTVQENLELGSYPRRLRAGAKATMGEVFNFFPALAERRRQAAGSLSGGEQQMCAIGRAMMAKPRLLMLDEPSLGLAPIIVEQIFDLIQQLAGSGLTILLVEQNANDALDMADRGYVLDQGQIAMTGSGRELLARDDLQRAYLGL